MTGCARFLAVSLLVTLLPSGLRAGEGASEPDATVVFDPSMPTYKDLSASRAFPCCGYAGCIADEGPAFCDEFFVRHPDETWGTFRRAGAYAVKLWNADWQWETDKVRAKLTYDWRKKHNVKTILCIEHDGWSIDDARSRILAFVQWIVDNGYTDQIVGFELGNEPYWGAQPEKFAERWAEIVPGMKEIWPEAQIGFAIAEYYPGDPDIEAVRKRSTAVGQWFEGSGEFDYKRMNQWSGRFIVAFSNCLHLCSHVIYHFYGGWGPYGCSQNGIRRIRHFAKAFPEVKDKKVWITEWRIDSDGDLRIQQSYHLAMFDAMYMLMCVCQPEIDGIFAHQCGQLSGGFYIAGGRGLWSGQRRYDKRAAFFVDPDWTGRPRLEVGPTGPAFRLVNETALLHPHVLARGRRKGGSIDDDRYWSSQAVASSSARSGCTALEWVLYADPARTRFALVVANAGLEDWRPTVKTVGCRLGKPRYQFYRCKPEHESQRQYAGEPRLSWEESSEGKTAGELVIPGLTIASVFYDVEKEGGK